MKHKHCEVIKAWAEGAEIQIKTLAGEWIDKEGDPLWHHCYEYRVKPETVRYRVALIKTDRRYDTFSVSDDIRASHLQGVPCFVRWLTDWQEAEV